MPSFLNRPLIRYALVGFVILMAGLIGYFLMTREDAAPIKLAPNKSKLAPADELPPPTMQGAEKSEQLVKRYPFDARVRYLRFLYYVNRNEFEKAESEIDLALATEDILNKQRPGANLPHRFVYATYLNGRRHVDEARAIAWPVCEDKHEKLEPLRVKLRASKLCTGPAASGEEQGQ